MFLIYFVLMHQLKVGLWSFKYAQIYYQLLYEDIV